MKKVAGISLVFALLVSIGPEAAATSTGNYRPAGAGPVATGTDPQDLVVADFNGDGHDDVASANRTADSVTIMLGNGTGGFVAGGTSVGDNPFGIATGDFNGDGYADLITANLDSNDTTVLLGNNNGSFTAAPTPPTSFDPYDVVVGRFDNNTTDDIVLSNFNASDVVVWLGDGDGTFTLKDEYVATGSSTLRRMAVGHFDADPAADLAVTVQGSNDVAILSGNGDGSFDAATAEDTGGTPTAVAVGLFNADAFEDLAVSFFEGSSGNVTILLGDGTGNFTAAAGSPEGGNGGGASVAAGDLNGDAHTDLAVGRTNSSVVEVLLGDGTGNFAAPLTESMSDIVPSVALGTFDNDAIDDIAVAVDNDTMLPLLSKDVRPDAAIRRLGDASFVGINEYGTEQTVTKRVKRRKTANFEIVLDNDGFDGDTVRVQGCAGTNVEYSVITPGDVTDAVQAGTHEVTLAGGAQVLTLTIKAKRKQTCDTTVTSMTDPALTDTVRAVVKIKS